MTRPQVRVLPGALAIENASFGPLTSHFRCPIANKPKCAYSNPKRQLDSDQRGSARIGRPGSAFCTSAPSRTTNIPLTNTWVMPEDGRVLEV